MAEDKICSDWGWPEMEEALQCPVCFELPSCNVLMCVKGHHICSLCRQQIFHCPICKGNFGDTRNFAVETLLANITVIKNLMTLSNISIKTPCRNESPKAIVRQESKSLPPVQSRGEFPCVFCAKLLPVSRTLIHLRYMHMDDLIEVTSENQRASFQIEFKYIKSNNTDFNRHRAVKIDKMGVFYITQSNVKGISYVLLRMLARTTDAKNYNYSLKVNDVIHESRAVCCREPIVHLIKKNDCLIINSSSMRNRSLPINVTVYRGDSSDYHT